VTKPLVHIAKSRSGHYTTTVRLTRASEAHRARKLPSLLHARQAAQELTNQVLRVHLPCTFLPPWTDDPEETCPYCNARRNEPCGLEEDT
jgi:hypothetical protein